MDGRGSRHDLTLHEQLIQRASMGGPGERAALARFEETLAEALASAAVAELQREAAEHGAHLLDMAGQPSPVDRSGPGEGDLE